ncbi:MAG: hypothetical protein QOE14_1323, partial [Humisphaera sp.]|nr:hypothetical protein [Humisphaera sp.]
QKDRMAIRTEAWTRLTADHGEAVPLGDRHMHESPRSRLLAYGVALPILALALILRWRFHSVLGERALYSSFIPAVMIAAYFGGFWPGFVVTLASAIASNYFIVEPRFTLQLKGTGDDVAMFLFVLSGTFISILSESLHRARRRIVADERRRAEDALRDTEERFRQLAENIHEIFWMADLGHTRITYVSPAFDQVWGRTAQSLYDHPRSWLESIHPDDRAAVIENMEQRQHGVFNDLEFRIVRPDGAIRWLRSRAFPINDLESGALSRVAGLVEDITYRKRAEAELRQAKERLELAVRGTNVGIWDNEIPDGDPEYGHLQYLNVWEQLGYDGPPHAEAVALDLAHPEDRARAFEAGRRYLAGETNEFEMEVRYSHKDGSDRIMLQRGAAVRDAAGKLIRLTGVIIDITRLKHAEEALRASEWRFRALVQNSSDIISLFDADGTILYQSPSIERLLGYPPQDRIGHNIFSDPIVHPDDLEAKRAFFNKARSRPGVLVTAEFRMRHADGSWRDIEAIGQNFLEDPGVAGIVANYRDITERKQAEDAMRSSDARMRQLVSLMPAAVYTCDAEGRLTFYNRRAAELWGREPQLVTDDSRFCGSVRLWKLDGSPLPHELTPIASCIRDGRSTRNTEVVIEQPDGKRVIVSVNIEALHNQEGVRTGAINVFEDITERKRAEEAVQRLAALLRLSDDAIVVWRLDGGIESWSRGAEELYGFTEAEALGRRTHELLRTVHPVPWSEIETKLRAGGSWEGELRHRTKDGREVIVSTRHQLVRDPDGAWRVLECNRDITDRKRDEALLDGQKRILELIIQGEPLPDVLAVLCRTIEDLTTEAEMLASVLLLDADGVHVRHGAAPSLPESYIRAIDGLPIGPSAGSCGTAAYRREPVYVSDIASDPLWAQYAGLALSHNLRACWSAPILSSTGGVLGTFAMYYRQPRQPTARDLRTVDIVTRTVAIAIEQSRAEEALRVSEERFRTLAKATNDAVWDWDFASNKVWWNEGVFTLFGYVLEANEADPTWWLERIHPDDREAVETFFHGVVHGHELSWVDEYRFRCADGSYKDVYDRGYVIRDAEGRAVRMIGAMLDITARKRAEEALRESEQRWRDLTQALPQFVWTARPDGFMDYGSPQIEQYMGRPESDVLGWRWLEMLHPDDQARTQQAWQTAVEAKQSEYEIEHRFRRFDGAYRWFKTRGVAIPDSKGDSYKWFGTSTDITTVKQHEEELRLANERLHLGLFNSNIAIWEVDMPEGDFQRGRRYYANAWEQLGYERSEVPPDAPLMSEARVHPDERAAVKEAIRKYLAGETDKFELEHRLLHKDGSYRCMLTRGVVVRDAGGKPIRFIGSAVDITDR